MSSSMQNDAYFAVIDRRTGHQLTSHNIVSSQDSNTVSQ